MRYSGKLLNVLLLGTLSAAAALAQRHAGMQQSGTFHPAIQPVRLPQSIGLSPRSIGLSPSPVGFVGVPPHPPFAPSSPGHGHHGGKNGVLPYGFVGAPFFPYLGTTYTAEEPPLPPQPADPGENILSDQLHELSAQLQDLQNQLARSSQPNPPSPSEEQAAAPPPPVPPVTIVLKDGSTFQTRNYAVVGDMFWDLSNQPARKIPVLKIDVALSVKASEASGAEFPAMAAAQ